MSSPKQKAGHSATYLRFLNLLHAVRQLPTFSQLDPVEDRLLQELGARWHQGQRVTVLQAMEMESAGSSSTVHRRLKGLRSKGYIELVPDEIDGRVRYVVATAEATRYFGQLGASMREAVAKTAA